MIGIYKITNKINGKLYIGQSVDIERRLSKHKNGKTNIILSRSIKKYGIDNFTFEPIIECEQSFLNYYEERVIALYNSLSPNGYNLTTGGDSNFSYSDEVIQKMSESHKGIIPLESTKQKRRDTMLLFGRNKGESNGMYGKSSWMKDKTHTPENKLKMATRCVSCVFQGVEYKSKKEIMDKFNLTYRQVNRMIQ